MKNLKIAEIVPVSCLEMTSAYQYHMCLAHLVGLDNDESKKYTDFYRRMSDEGRYVLMDNGAAEGSQLDFASLIKKYELIHPTEIVLPDALLDSEETVGRTVTFYRIYKEMIKDYKLMVVPQGRTFDEWCKCAVDLLSKVPVDTVGVSKFLEMDTGEPNIRVRACEFLRNFDVEIHLLGCSEGPAVVRNARAVNKSVRGCDSAFVYIHSKIDDSSITLDSVRTSGEIDFLNDPVTSNLVNLMGNFEAAAGVESNLPDGSWEDD